LGAEKQIVSYWLNKKGFYTLNNIKAGSRNIDFIAINFKDGAVSQIKHIEVSCSISSTSISLPKIKESINKLVKIKFSSPVIEKTIKKTIKDLTRADAYYEKILITSMLPKSNKGEIIGNFINKGIKIYEFEDVLSEVIRDIDTYYYKDDTIRSLQIVKYLLLAKPSKLAGLIGEAETEILKGAGKEKLIISLLKHGEVSKALERLDEKDMAALIKHSALKNPDALARMIAEDILGKRSKGRFMKSLMEQEAMKRFFKEKIEEEKQEIKKKDKTLGFFFNS